MSGILPPLTAPDLEVGTLIIGAGACGMVAALAAAEAGQQVLVVEADAIPAGSTALSAGLIPAAGTRYQAAIGIEDDAGLFAADIQAKAKGQNDPALVAAMAGQSAGVIEWLADRHGLPFSLVDDFDYPGHARRRMHGLPTRSGAELIDRLRAACESAGIDIVCGLRATHLHAADGHVSGVTVARTNGATETIGCDRLILACNGFGGDPTKVARHMPDIAGALWFGHDGNRGEALDWGQALGAATAHLGSYQGHGNVAHPHGILITWAVITQGGVQVNTDGERFWDESQGYSEAARVVLAQPGGQVWTIFDERIAAIARQFADFRLAETQGAIRCADTVRELATITGLPEEQLSHTLSTIPPDNADEFGRQFFGMTLSAPYRAVRVTGALFHTQGGLATDLDGRVLRVSGEPFPNLFAAGGAACGVSGRGESGYLSGNGLLAATVMGYIAGRAC
ncbi:MAG: FAD-dependent oxidoreductase [Paracoccus sp.]|nr:FAD-dependent oxidoreductase [Paracoccus sp. (in: a-proteobacteria)]